MGGALEVEALESELARLLQAGACRSREHHACLSELEFEVREAEASGHEQQRLLHGELAEAWAEAELQEAELRGASCARRLLEELLEREECWLLCELRLASDE